MIKRLFLGVVTVFLALVSCEDQDDALDAGLQGKWTLVSVSCYCEFSTDVDFGSVGVTFTGADLTVQNTGDLGYFANAEGHFTQAGRVLTFINGERYTYDISENGMLTLTYVDDPEIADDEISYSFEKAD